MSGRTGESQLRNSQAHRALPRRHDAVGDSDFVAFCFSNDISTVQNSRS